MSSNEIAALTPILAIPPADICCSSVGRLLNCSEYMNTVSDLFHKLPKENMIIVIHTGLLEGMIMLQNITFSLAPSILADSIMESGNAIKFCRIKYNPRGKASDVNTNDSGLLINFSLDRIMY